MFHWCILTEKPSALRAHPLTRRLLKKLRLLLEKSIMAG